MPEVVRGSLVIDRDQLREDGLDPTSPTAERVTRLDEQEAATAAATSSNSNRSPSPAANHTNTSSSPSSDPANDPSPRRVAFRVGSGDSQSQNQTPADSRSRERRGRSGSFFRNSRDTRPEEAVYYDSRAATKREYRRRGTTLSEYYQHHPELLPQLPFTFHRGTKRWWLILLIAGMWIDACVVPIALYYGMHYGGHVEGWIIFAVVTTVWGGPTYFEFAVRTLALMKVERFYRPLNTTSRWCFDYLTWVSVVSILVVTALFIIGSAPHLVWLRVLCMPMPALLYCLGSFAAFPTLYHIMGWKAPFRLSSTSKGDAVRPGVYYFVEDTIALSGNAGRPYREALDARYEASPRFRRMMYNQSLFWSIPPFLIAIPLTIVATRSDIPGQISYGICWAVPFIWATVWGFISMWWCKRDLAREVHEWETTRGPIKIDRVASDPEIANPVKLEADSSKTQTGEAV